METQGHRRLRRFLKTSGLTPGQLCKIAGLSPPQLSHLLMGRRRASLEVAVKLQKATRRAVPCESWVTE